MKILNLDMINSKPFEPIPIPGTKPKSWEDIEADNARYFETIANKEFLKNLYDQRDFRASDIFAEELAKVLGLYFDRCKAFDGRELLRIMLATDEEIGEAIKNYQERYA